MGSPRSGCAAPPGTTAGSATCTRSRRPTGHARRLAEIRDELGREGDFRFITALTDAFLPEQFAAAEAVGVTDVWTMPWAYYHGLDCTLEQKLDGIRRFAEDVLKPLG